LRSSRQGERETDLKKASRTPANNSGKRNLAVIQEADEPYGSDGSPGRQKKVACQVGAIDAGIEVEPDTHDGEHNLSWQLADRTSPTNSPSPFIPNPDHHHASAASEQGEARRSAAHLLMLASRAEQPVNTLATQVNTPGSSHSPSKDPHTGDVCAYIPTAQEVGRELSPPADTPKPRVHNLYLVSSGYDYQVFHAFCWQGLPQFRQKRALGVCSSLFLSWLTSSANKALLPRPRWLISR